MAEMKVIPNVVTHKFLTGNTVTGVSPVGSVVEFEFDNEAGGPFTDGESLTWAGPSTGTLLKVDSDGSVGTMSLAILTGNAPVDNDTITGVSSGATCDVDGDTADAMDSQQSIQRGRYREYIGLTAGGLVELPSALDGEGFTVVNVRLNLPGVTAVSFRVVDPSGAEYSADSITPTAGLGYFEWRNGGIIIPPGCGFKVVGTGTLSSAGQIMFVLSKGWGQNLFTSSGGIGVESLPPSMRRT